MKFAVRKAKPSDWDAITRVCGETGAGGGPVDESERAEFADHWIRPYRQLRPDWTWVAESEGVIVAYLTGSPDSIPFEQERRKAFSPGPDSRDFFPQAVRFRLWREHPGHFMLSVSADFRGQGVGARLIQAFFAELRRAGVPSVHVICGPSSLAFFERMAFRAEAVVSPAPGVTLRAMTRPTE